MALLSKSIGILSSSGHVWATEGTCGSAIRRGNPPMSNADRKLLFFPLCGVPSKRRGCGTGNFLFHLTFFPAASFPPGEGFSVVTAVAWFISIARRVKNLLSYPSLPGHDWRLAEGALVCAT